MTIKGTAGGGNCVSKLVPSLEAYSKEERGRGERKGQGCKADVLLMSVRTLAISVMILDLTLPSAPGAWPKAGSYEDGERFTVIGGCGQSWVSNVSCFQS